MQAHYYILQTSNLHTIIGADNSKCSPFKLISTPLVSKSNSKTKSIMKNIPSINAMSTNSLATQTVQNSSSSLSTSTKRVRYEPASSPELLKVTAKSLQYESGFLGAVPDRKSVEAAGDEVHDAMSYVTMILKSKVYDIAVETPLHYAGKLSERLGIHFWLKREDLRPAFSFKLRGAYNMMAKLSKEQLARGVICSSSGNHAQAVALAAQKLGCNAVVAVPIITPETKRKTVVELGARIVVVGESNEDTQAYATKRAKDEGLAYVPAFDNPDVIAGNGTVGMEIVRQMAGGSLHAIFVPVGGGGLVSGIAAYVKRVCPQVKVIGVEPFESNAMALSMHHGQRIMLDKVGVFADGVASKVVGQETFRLCRELIDGVVLVRRDAICASIKDMLEENRSILEPAGALAIAGAEAYCKYYGLKSENVVAITSGGNMNFDKLRLVSQLAEVGRQREAVLATLVPDNRGSLKQFCELIGQMNITEFRYRYDTSKEALILYSVGFHIISELREMIDRMKSARLQTFNLTDKDIVKDHLQFLVGGRSNVKNEILSRFIFPERPGALMKLLEAFTPRWNITLLHYRGQGASGANILVGFQVAGDEMNEFKAVAYDLGCDYTFETNNEALQLLLH